jgi:UDP-2,4-diacetamido-2,4,6-trideoxy-beta-L-altropyranose hydrolase
VECGELDDARQVASIVEQYDDPVVVLDGYHFGSEYQQIISKTDSTFSIIDDFAHADDYFADIILNQGLYADRSLYPSAQPDTTFLLGSEYILLRNEFREWINYQPTIPPTATNVLLTFGGTDPDNITALCLEAINELETEFSITVVLGSANRHYKSVATAASSGHHDVDIRCDIDNMSEVMAWADMAVAAAGTTIWELAFMGLPSILIDIASNQRSSTVLDEMDIAMRLGTTTTISPGDIQTGIQTLADDTTLREKMSENGRNLVDGLGPKRVLDAITRFSA